MVWRVEEARNYLSQMDSLGTPLMPDFTLHNHNHSDNVVLLLAWLHDQFRYKLNDHEAYLLAASAYLRRVVEKATDRVLALLEEHARLDGDQDRVRSLAAARGGRNAEQKLELASQNAPPILRVSGGNALQQLYGLLSKDLHDSDEQACIEHAELLRDGCGSCRGGAMAVDGRAVSGVGGTTTSRVPGRAGSWWRRSIACRPRPGG